MPLDLYDYKNMTDYLQHLYQCKPYTRNGIEHPTTVYYPSEAQVRDVDSIIDPYLPTQENTDFIIYDYSYLHDLQNSKPALFNGRTFTLNFIRTNPLRMRGALGHYYDMLATGANLEHELRDAIEQGWMRAPSRATLHRFVDPTDAILRGTGRSAAIGIGTLTVFNDTGTYKALLARRSYNTTFDSGMYHVLPAMMFQPTTKDFQNPQEWSIKHQVYREILEELFNMPEQHKPERWDFFYDHPALVYLLELMEAGKAHLYLTGIVFNLLTLRPEVGTLLLIHDPEWYARITAPDSDIPFRTADETLSDTVVAAPMMTDGEFLSHFPADLHFRMPVQATTAMWLGIDLARKEIMRGY